MRQGIFAQNWLPQGMSVPADATEVKLITGPPPGYAGGQPAAAAGFGAFGLGTGMTGPCPFPPTISVVQQILIAPTSFTSAPFYGMKRWQGLMNQAYAMGGSCSVEVMVASVYDAVFDAAKVEHEDCSNPSNCRHWWQIDSEPIDQAIIAVVNAAQAFVPLPKLQAIASKRMKALAVPSTTRSRLLQAAARSRRPGQRSTAGFGAFPAPFRAWVNAARRQAALRGFGCLRGGC
jgi:hypothetical protein